jgi:hypothetical protein
MHVCVCVLVVILCNASSMSVRSLSLIKHTHTHTVTAENRPCLVKITHDCHRKIVATYELQWARHFSWPLRATGILCRCIMTSRKAVPLPKPFMLQQRAGIWRMGAGYDVLRGLRVSGSGGECSWRCLSSVGSGPVILWASVSECGSIQVLF